METAKELSLTQRIFNRANIMTLIVVVILALGLVIVWRIWSENRENIMFVISHKEWGDLTRKQYMDNINILK